MKKAILISIHPQWVEKILNDIKKDEIRKGTAIGKAINRLIKEQGVAPMLIYCTKNGAGLVYDVQGKGLVNQNLFPYAKRCPEHHRLLNGKVVARFNASAEHIEYETCSRDISGWWKDNGKMYNHKDACLTYKEMFDYIGAGEGTVIHINDLEIFDKPKELSEFKHTIKKHYYNADFDYGGVEEITLPLTRAPQSWQFIEFYESIV